MIILEGILIFHDLRVRELMNMKIFVDTVQMLMYGWQGELGVIQLRRVEILVWYLISTQNL